MMAGRLFASPPDWADELDFVGPRTRTARWAWLLLWAGLAAVLAIMPMVQASDEALAQARDTLRRLERATHQQSLKEKAMARRDERDGASFGLKPQAYPAAVRLARSLSFPWMAVLTKVEAAAHAQQAVLLSLSMDLDGLDGRAPAAPDLRIGAAVRDDEQALQWVQAHGPAAQLLDRQRLATPLMTRVGGYTWRVQALVPGDAR